ncbi:metallophosphoesterase [Leptospira sp. id769339]|uniref:metallophosphoesterase n=1 Tax=Leptospira sp. id769339 TaxID=2864221 RepID=UPI00214B7436|nr:metallophosphoesterase [Leptospira sp. id769339]MCR1795581.1 metallophosphoesterase [Leptospira sp. id769339]
MLLIHLSDLHFKKGEFDSPFDQNAHLRNELLKDVKLMLSELNKSAAAILISGDLTFAGRQEEFQYAEGWLSELCVASGAAFQDIFTVPGNHDVVRDISDKTVIQALHNSIKSESRNLNKKITQILTDDSASQLMYNSLENYNNFSNKFFCDLLPPKRTIAVRDLTLNDGSKLRIHGLNSTFVSSGADKIGDLFIDPSALRITRNPGIENLIICHHPYNWIRNGDELRDHFNVVSKLQLFGHEHINRNDINRDFVRLFASAGHPDRDESDWEPGYNIIVLNVIGDSSDRKLEVKVYARVWQKRPGKFIPKEDMNEKFFHQEIRLENWELNSSVSHAVLLSRGVKTPVAEVEEIEKVVESSDTKMNSLREISIRFFKLSSSQKLAIAEKFELLDDNDLDQPNHEKFRRVLLRAMDRNLIENLDEEIKKCLNEY